MWRNRPPILIFSCFKRFSPNGAAFAIGSDDASRRLFDIRADREFNTFTRDDIFCGITSVAFFVSGEYNGRILNVQRLGYLRSRKVHALAGHENSIGCSGVSLCDNCGISVTIDQIIFMFVLWVHMRGVSKSESAGRKREEPSGRRTWNPGLKQLRGGWVPRSWFVQ